MIRHPFLRATPKNSFMDPLMLACEIYNPNKFPIFFLRQVEKDRYIELSGKARGPHRIECAADGFCTLPHRYYVVFADALPNGEPIQVVVNEGKTMGTGNKKASGVGVR